MEGSESRTVGFIGLGKMGSAMAGRIVASGAKVIGWDVREAACQALAAGGATIANGMADMAKAPLVISMLFDDATTREAVLAPDGLIDHMLPGAVHMSGASISPELARELSEAHTARGQRFVSGSVFGLPPSAVAGTLIINCSGEEQAFDEAAPVLRTMGTPQYLGSEPEQAILLKLMGNNMIFSAAELLCEAFALLGASGITEATVKESLIDRLFPGFIFDGYSRRYIEGNRTPFADIAIVSKDNALCLAAAEKRGISLPLIRGLRDEVLTKIENA